MPKTKYNNALGLDIGDKRIGVARVNSVAKLPEPLCTIQNDDELVANLKNIVDEHQIDLIVVGLPRNMSGQETAQSQAIKDFVKKRIKPNFQVSIIFQDETLSSVEATRYNPATIAQKGIDAVAAAEILRYFI